MCCGESVIHFRTTAIILHRPVWILVLQDFSEVRKPKILSLPSKQDVSAKARFKARLRVFRGDSPNGLHLISCGFKIDNRNSSKCELEDFFRG